VTVDARRLNVLIVTYHYPPDGEIGAVRPHQLARHLPAFGFDAWVLTVEPRHAESPQTGLVPPGTGEERVVRTGVDATIWDRLVRLKASLSSPGPPALDDRPAGAANPITTSVRWWATTRDRRAGWYRPAVQAGDALIHRVGIDLLLSTSPPRVAARVAHELASRRRLPWVMDLRDPFVAESGGGGLAEALLRRTLRSEFLSHVRQARLLVHNTERLRQLTCRLAPGAERKTLCIPNGLDPEWRQPPSDASPEVFRVGYYGQIMGRRSPAVFFEGVDAWLRATRPDPSRVCIRFVGSGFEDVPRQASRLGLQRLVELHPPVPRHEIPRMMSGDFVLLLLANAQPVQVPGKTYEYLASGRRIIALTERDSATAEALEGQGACAVTENANEVASALDRFFAEYQARSSPRVDRADAVREMDYSRRVERYAAALRAVARVG
jgi:glycosyltransferase involved in cell wall biosynthesis